MSPLNRLPLAGFLVACLLAAPAMMRASDKGALDQIFGAWFATQGGLGSAPLVRNQEVWESVEFVGQDRPKMDVHFVRTQAGHYRFEISLPSLPGTGPIIQAFDGNIAWQAQREWGLGLEPNAGRDLWFLQNDLLLGVKAFKPRISYRALSPAVVNGHPCVVAATTDAAGMQGKCFFDRKTHELLRMECSVGKGAPLQIAFEFDDFRDVGGLQIPFYAKVSVGPSGAIYHRSKVVINPTVDEGSFVLSTAQLTEAMAADSIIRRHDQTIVGGKAAAGITSRVTRLSLEISTSGLKCSEIISQKNPNSVLLEISTPGMGTEFRGFDGTTGWVESELQGYRPLKPGELLQLMNESRMHLETRLGESFPFRRRLGERTIEGRPTLALALSTYLGPSGTYYFDKQNGHLLRIESPAVGDRTNSTESTIDFSDFRVVDGIEIPFVITQVNPLLRAVSTVQSVVNNPSLDSGIFRPRRED